jgi:hypothetical protein
VAYMLHKSAMLIACTLCFTRTTVNSVNQIEVANGVGQRIAGVTALSTFATAELYIDLQGTRVRVVAEDGPAVPDAALAPLKYADLKEQIMQLGATTMSMQDFRALCAQVSFSLCIVIQ